ncbi:MAG TPA: hypothetical protein VK489_01700 [Ferruginibacter sp.]|nr:hypothetical protein [Ferruginibacter sp.]
MKKMMIKMIMIFAVAISFSAAEAQFVVKIRPPHPGHTCKTTGAITGIYG